MASKMYRDTCTNAIVLNDEESPSKSTMNYEQRRSGSGSEDAHSSPKEPAIGEHYLVRRPDGSFCE